MKLLQFRSKHRHALEMLVKTTHVRAQRVNIIRSGEPFGFRQQDLMLGSESLPLRPQSRAYAVLLCQWRSSSDVS